MTSCGIIRFVPELNTKQTDRDTHLSKYQSNSTDSPILLHELDEVSFGSLSDKFEAVCPGILLGAPSVVRRDLPLNLHGFGHLVDNRRGRVWGEEGLEGVWKAEERERENEESLAGV